MPRVWLAEALHCEHGSLHAYVLMNNHVQLLVTPRDARDYRIWLVLNPGCPAARHAAGREGRSPFHHGAWRALTAAHQPRLRVNPHPVRQLLPILAGPVGDLRVCLPALYRAQAGPRTNGE